MIILPPETLTPWQLRHRTLRFQPGRPLLMGIVNVTPDSFSDGGRFFSPAAAIAHGLSLVEQGADILDIGGESTRPGATPVSAQEEIKRVLPVIKELAQQTKIPLSIDTTKPEVAAAALDAGAEIVNDISCLRFHPELATVVADRGARLIVMHSRHTPANMQHNPSYQSLWDELKTELQAGLEIALSAGVPREHLAIDPGIGFGKRTRDNYTILKEIQELRQFALPILVGASRKSFLEKVLHSPPHDRLEGSLAAAAAATLGGAHLLRVHDVKETRRLVDVLAAIYLPEPKPTNE